MKHKMKFFGHLHNKMAVIIYIWSVLSFSSLRTKFYRFCLTKINVQYKASALWSLNFEMKYEPNGEREATINTPFDMD